MIKAIIFDCFGVLAQGTLREFYDRHGFTEAQCREADDLDYAASRGRISYEDHVVGLSELANISADVAKNELEDNPPNEKLLSYIEQKLKPHYKVGFLSNASSNWLDELFTREQQALFDDIVLSYAVKLAKPDERIYELAANNLDVLPNECLFVDDQERYVAAARDVGMRGLVYENFRQFESDIHKLLD